MGAQGFSCSVEAHVARITLTRPERHNALGAADIADLGECIDGLAADPLVRVLLLTGAGEQSFCSGASLQEFANGEMSGELFSTLTDRLAAIAVPSVCVLNGNAWGGGAELALCCDYRIGVEGMRLGVPAARIGLCYPVSGLQRYVGKLGLSAAKRILVAAEELDTAALLATGFLHRVVPRAALAADGARFAAELAALAPLAVRAMKRILGEIAQGELDHEAAEQAVRRCADSADLREGLAARREKRKPVFRGC